MKIKNAASLLLIGLVSLSLPSQSFADKAPKPGTFYKDSELNISKKEVKGSRLHLTFKPKKETFYWCPGVLIKSTPKATVVTFVRQKTSKSVKVDKKANYGRKMLTQEIVIDTKNRDTYIRNGAKNFKKIYAPGQQEQSTQTKNVTVGKPSESNQKADFLMAPPEPEGKVEKASLVPTPAELPVGEIRPSTASPRKRRLLLNEHVAPTVD